MRLETALLAPNVAYATVQQWLFKSTDFGNTWRDRSGQMPDLAPADGDDLHAESWNDPNFVAPSDNDDHLHGVAVAPSDPQIVYVGSGHSNWPDAGTARPKVWKSTDGGATFCRRTICGSATGCPLPSGCGFVPPEQPVPGWNNSVQTSLFDIAVSPTNPDHVFIATFGHENYPDDEDEGQGVLRSLDGGATWELVNGNLPSLLSLWVGGVAIANVAGQETAFIATLDGLYSMATTGTVWTRNSTIPESPPRFESVAIDPLDSSIIYVGTAPRPTSPPREARIYRSTDGGSTWVNMPLPSTPHAWDVGPGRYGGAPCTAVGDLCKLPRVRELVVGQRRAYAAVEGAGTYVLETCRDGFNVFPGTVADVGQSLLFTATCPSPPCFHEWDFGDGSPIASGQAVSYAYGSPGFFTARHTTIDGSRICTSTKQIEIRGADSELITGIGWDPNNGNAETARGFKYVPSLNTVGRTQFGAVAYATPHFGVNVATDDVNGGDNLAEVLTGPGPGPVFGPHVKGWRGDGSFIARINFYAYGTLKYGVNVAMADLDVDGAVEIVTGAGPGQVFGPHVRGWDYDENRPAGQAALQAMAGVSFFAYGTLRYGVNVAGADTSDPAAGCNNCTTHDEIYTGPGPGPVFGPTLRGFGGPPMAIVNSSFTPANWPQQFGAKVAGGNFAGGTFDGVVAAKGPGQALDTELVAFTGIPATQVARGNAFAGVEDQFGTNVAVGSNEGLGGTEILFAGTGPSSTNQPHVVGLKIVGARIEQFETPNPIDFFPWAGGSPAFYGATVAAVPASLSNFTGGPPKQTISAAESLAIIRGLIAGVPDRRTVDFSLDPQASVVINEWQADASKDEALVDVDFLQANLFDLELSVVVAKLEDVKAIVQASILNDLARVEIIQEIDRLIAFFAGGESRTGATVANISVEGPGQLGQIETSVVVPNTAYVVKQDPEIAHLHTLSVGGLSDLGSVDVDGTVHDLAISVPEGRLYSIQAQSFSEFFCPPFEPCPPRVICRICRIGQVCPPRCIRLFVTSGSLSQVTPELLTQEVARGSLFGPTPRVLILTPTLYNPSLPAKAYVSTSHAVFQIGDCPEGGQVGGLVVVSDLGAVPSSDVISLDHTTPFYEDMAPSPVAGDPTIFAAYECGVDAIDASTDTIQERFILGFGGHVLRAGRIGEGVFRLFALDFGTGTVSAYDLGSRTVVAEATVLDARTFELTADRKGLVVLSTEDGGKLRVLDSTTLDLQKTVPIGVAAGQSAEHIAVTADGTRVLVSDAARNIIEVVQIAREVIAQQVDNLGTVLETLPDKAFIASPDLSRQRRKALLNKLTEVRALVAQAEEEQVPAVKDDLLRQATNKVENDILKKMDGFFGGDLQNDWIKTEEAQKLLVPLVRSFLTRLATAVSPPPEGPPQTFP